MKFRAYLKFTSCLENTNCLTCAGSLQSIAHADNTPAMNANMDDAHSGRT